MAIYDHTTKGTVIPKLTIGNVTDGGKPARARMRMFRMGQRHLSSYEYDTLDIGQIDGTGGNKHIVVNEIERFFDRGGKGKPGATITDPRMTTGAVVFIPMDEPLSELGDEIAWETFWQHQWGDLTDERLLSHNYNDKFRYFTRSYTDDMVAKVEGGYRSRDMNVQQESVALQFKLTQVESGREAYFDNSRFMVSNILWEFSPDGGRGRWYQLYELPNQKVRITLPSPTQQIRLRAISNNPEEWVQSMAITPRTDFQNRLAQTLYWDLDDESATPDDYIEFDDMGYLSWPKAIGGHGDVVYTLYWTPEEEMGDDTTWVLLAKTKRNDLAPEEFNLPIHYLGGWVHIFANDILSTLHIKMRFMKSIVDCAVICTPSEPTYTGYAIRPNIEVRFKLDWALLPPEYYDVEYRDNVNVGEGTVIVTGKEFYYGTPEEPGKFTIMPADVNNCVETLDPSSFVYGRVEREPSVTLMLGSFEVPSNNYSVSYSDNFNAGTGHVTVVGSTNMKGERTDGFEITKSNDLNIELTYYSGEYGECWDLPGWTIYGIDDELIEVGDVSFQFTPGTIVNVGQYVARANVNGANYSGSVSATFELMSADLSNVTMEPIEPVWVSFQEIKPKPLVVREEVARNGQRYERVLVEGTDFYYSWEDNILPGEAKVIITGIGNYTGQAEESFTIKPLTDITLWGEVRMYTWGVLVNGWAWPEPPA